MTLLFPKPVKSPKAKRKHIPAKSKKRIAHRSSDAWRERNGPDFFYIPETRKLVAAMSD